MPVRPSGRVSYEGLNSTLAGGITPMPMGTMEAELWPRLNKAMEMLEVASKKEPMNATLEELYSHLRRGFEEYRTRATDLYKQSNIPSLDEILNPKFTLRGETTGAWPLNRSEGEGIDELTGRPGTKMGQMERYFTLNDLKKSVGMAEDFLERFHK